MRLDGKVVSRVCLEGLFGWVVSGWYACAVDVVLMVFFGKVSSLSLDD